MSEIYAGSIVAVAIKGLSRTIEHAPARVVANSEAEAKGKLFEVATKWFPGHQLSIMLIDPSIPPVDDPKDAGIVNRRPA